MSTLITKTTLGASADFMCDASHLLLPVTIVCNGLGGAEAVAVHVSGDGGITYAPAFDATGTAIALTSTKNVITINAPGMFRVVKPTTVAAVGVGASTMSGA